MVNLNRNVKCGHSLFECLTELTPLFTNGTGIPNKPMEIIEITISEIYLLNIRKLARMFPFHFSEKGCMRCYLEECIS